MLLKKAVKYFWLFCLLGNAYAATTYTTYQIQNSNDDATEIISNGNVLLAEGMIKLGYHNWRSKRQIAGFRFAGVDIPKDAMIRSAYLRFYANNDYSAGPVNFTITGEAADNSAPFADVASNISTRPRTAAMATWSPPDWDEPWVSKEIHRTADIANVIKEIIARPGFQSGNAITFFVEGDGTNLRGVYSYDYYLSYPERIRFARLVIEYDISEVACDFNPSILDSVTTDFLPDYSFAGYRWGEEDIPNLTASSPDVSYVDMTVYGATPDDATDDTLAVYDAIAAHQNSGGTVLLHFPAGRFLISDVIKIERSNFVIQGEGSGDGGTVFEIGQPLALTNTTVNTKIDDIVSLYQEYGGDPQSSSWPKESGGDPYSLYSWTGGYFYTRNTDSYYGAFIADVAGGAKRGDHSFTVENKSQSVSLQVGDVVRFTWANPADNGFLHYLLGPDPVTIGSSIDGAHSSLVVQPVTITVIDGNQITIREPLMHDVGPGWTATIAATNLLENIGFENFRIEFPDTVYGGHHLEAGYNGIYMTELQHSWVKNVSIHNADSGIIMDHCKNSTIKNLSCTGREGHYTVNFGSSYGLLATGFNFEAPALHNPSCNSKSIMNVYSGGHVEIARFDQHNYLNHQNLFDNITVRYSQNLFKHGGNATALPTAAMYNTFWNIEMRELPYNNVAGSCEDAPGARIVGLYSPGNSLSVNYAPNPYIEGLNRCLSVVSLYTYQLGKRMNTSPPDLADVILALQVASGKNPEGISLTDETSGDGCVGIAEAIMALRAISGL